MRERPCVSVALAVLLLSAGAASGQGVLYFSEDSNANGLYILDTTTGAATNVGASGVGGATVGLTESPSPTLLYGSMPFGFLHINTDGSGASMFGTTGIEGLATDPTTGTVYGVINESFFTVDPATGAILTNLASPVDDVEGLAWGNGGVYGIVGFGSSDTNLYFYNPGTNAWSVVASTGIDWDEVGLAYDPGANLLYAKGLQDSNLYSINPATGATTLIGDTGIAAGGGLAFVGASAPQAGAIPALDAVGLAALALALLGIALVLIGRRLS